MMPVSRTVVALPILADGAPRPPAMFDVDLDAQDNSLFAVGTGETATHVMFGRGALVRLPAPLYSCRVRLLDPRTALVWGAVRPSNGEPNAWMVDSTGSIRQTFSPIQYCADALCTENYIVLTYFEDQIGRGDAVSAEGLAVFDRNGRFLWGWNGTIREAARIGDCDAVVGLGANLIGIFASDEFPLVVADLATHQPVATHHPTPRVLHGAHAISMRDGAWYFVGPYGNKEAILLWHPGRGEPEIAGHVPARRRFRGLQGGRFISVAQDDAEVLTLG